MGLFSRLFGKNKDTEINSNFETTDSVQIDGSGMSIEEWRAYFDEIIISEFSNLTVKRNVSAAELVNITGLSVDFHPACTSVDFLFMKDNQPFLALVLVRTNTYRGMNVKGTQNICTEAGLEYVRFFTNMPNEREYVIDRLNSYLG